ncbi:RING-H2 finger protein ATL68, partial [Linum perenne]
PPPSNYITNLGLGYSIAIALGFLVLLPTILLASYICCRHRRRSPVRSVPPSSDDIILPRVIFVVEDDDDDARDGENSASAVGLDPAVINSYPRFSKDVTAAAAVGGFVRRQLVDLIANCPRVPMAE